MSQGHSESKMELMTLPIELVEMAVIEAIGIVGLLKAMKLRVVNKVFDRVIEKHLTEGDVKRRDVKSMLKTQPYFARYAQKKLDADLDHTMFLSVLVHRSIDLFLDLRSSHASIDVDATKRSTLATTLLEFADTRWCEMESWFSPPDIDYPGEIEDYEGRKADSVLAGAMVLASSLNDVSTIQELIRQGWQMNCSTFFHTALRAAAKAGSTDAARLLLDEGKGWDPHKALWTAAFLGYKDIVNLILDEKYDPRPKKKYREEHIARAIEAALRGRHFGLVDSLWRATGSQSHMWARLTLLYAARTGALSVVQELISQGTDFLEPARGFFSYLYCDTPLESAARAGMLEVVKFLLQKGAAKGKDGYGWALHEAALFGYNDVLEALLDDGADVKMNVERKYWGRPLDLAVEEKHDHIIDFLLRRGAEVDLVSKGKREYVVRIQQNLAK